MTAELFRMASETCRAKVSGLGVAPVHGAAITQELSAEASESRSFAIPRQPVTVGGTIAKQ